MPLRIADEIRVTPPKRDRVAAHDQARPALVSISDIHGYLDAARSALLTLRDHSSVSPVVIADDDGTLHWADENYVLVFNGDLIDRGPANEAVLNLVARLVAEAPPGRVRITLGNHEAIALTPDGFGFDGWYSGQVSVADRQALLRQILAGHVVAAYRGYNVTYAHAGAPDPYDVETVNESLIEAAEQLRDAINTDANIPTQRRVLTEYPSVLGLGDTSVKGPGAGLAWLDFSHLPTDAPPQVVGHTRHDTPRQKGRVYCQNVIRNNLAADGGEAVFVETPETLSAFVRQSNGEVSAIELDRFRGDD